MTLISTARALDNQDLKWRVMGASINHASGFAQISIANGQFYAISTILNPQVVDMSMVALVAMDPVVSAAIVVSGGAVDTSAVLDEDIQRVVSAKWALVGNKYKVNPLTPVVPVGP